MYEPGTMYTVMMIISAIGMTLGAVGPIWLLGYLIHDLFDNDPEDRLF